MLRALFVGTFVMLMFTACSKEEAGTTTNTVSLGDNTFFVREGSIQNTGSVLQGTGVLGSKYPVPGEMTKFALSYLLQDKGEVKVLAYTNDQLQNGAEVVVGREGDIYSQAKAKVPGFDDADFFGWISQRIEPSSVINLIVEIHNHGGEVHVEMYQPNKKGDATKAEFDDGHLNGTYWGISLTNAILRQVVVSEGSH